MPWRIEKRDDKFCVIKDDDGENEGCHETEEGAKRQMRALYSSENRAEQAERRAPIETRSATVGEVNYPERLIEVLAVPYEQEATVEYRGEFWRESFDRGAFDGVEQRRDRIKAYRDHDPNPSSSSGASTSGLVGKIMSLHPDRAEGLMGSVKIAKTPLGDETLTLADEGILGVSVGFAVRGRDQILDRVERRRRIVRAFLDHLAFPDNGAYQGAQVVGVRSGERRTANNLPRLDTPRLDEVVAWMESRRRG
jgi:phage head maturation protease